MCVSYGSKHLLRRYAGHPPVITAPLTLPKQVRLDIFEIYIYIYICIHIFDIYIYFKCWGRDISGFYPGR